jgi:hypothetical protein
MNKKLVNLVNEKLELLHNENVTLNVLYSAIGNCSNEDFGYHRDMVFDSFADNDILIKKINGKSVYLWSNISFNGDINKTKLDCLLEALTSIDGFPSDDLDDPKVIQEIKEWVEIEYKRFVFFIFTICLQSIDKLNESIFDDYLN